MSIAAHGYGIRYDHGLFRQAIKDGWQQEYPEDWLAFGNPWEFKRPEVNYPIGFGGAVEENTSLEGAVRHTWKPNEYVEAVAYDTPMVGWRARHVNTLRLWSARASEPLMLDAFNAGDYVGAHGRQGACGSDLQSALSERRNAGRSGTAPAPGILFRLGLAAGSAAPASEAVPGSAHAARARRDPAQRHASGDCRRRADAPPVRQHGIEWQEAWRITNATISYTNHTLLPEALESWPVPLLERLLPRHMQIIYLINALHLDGVRKAGHTDAGFISSVSMIQENGGRRVRMGHLAFIGSHKVNGVSALHTELLKQTVFRDFNTLYPERIVNKTNGITFRRWLFEANPGLTRLLADAAGDAVYDDPSALDEDRALRR